MEQLADVDGSSSLGSEYTIPGDDGHQVLDRDEVQETPLTNSIR
jgi:hypothetical protein